MKKQPVTKFRREVLAKKLVEHREAADLTRDEVVASSSTGFARSSLQAWENGEREPKLEYIYDLASIYGVAPWFLIDDTFQDSDTTTRNVQSNNDDYSYVPFYRAEASAGHGSFTDEHKQPSHHLAFRKRWLEANGFYIKDLVGLIASGDSMEPTIRSGAAIIVNTTYITPEDGNIYVIRVADRLWVKRTQWLLDGSLRLNSDNNFYDSMDLSRQDLEFEDIEIIGQVVHTAYDLIN